MEVKKYFPHKFSIFWPKKNRVQKSIEKNLHLLLKHYKLKQLAEVFFIHAISWRLFKFDTTQNNSQKREQKNTKNSRYTLQTFFQCVFIDKILWIKETSTLKRMKEIHEKKGQKHNKSIKGGNKNYVWLLCEWNYSLKTIIFFKGNSSIAHFHTNILYFAFYHKFVMNQNRHNTQQNECENEWW